MPLNIHEKEHLQTYAKSIAWVSQGSFELSSIDSDATGFIHADQGVRISANNAELIVTGETSGPAALSKRSPFIFAAVPTDGNILLDGNNGDKANISILQVGNGRVQAMGGKTGTVSSFLVDDKLIEGIVGIGVASVAHSKLSIKPASISLVVNNIGSLEISATSVKLTCGVGPAAASIELKPTGDITLKAGPTTELSLTALSASIKALESKIDMNAMEIKKTALTLGRDAQLVAKDVLTLLQQNTKAIADFKDSVSKHGP